MKASTYFDLLLWSPVAGASSALGEFKVVVGFTFSVGPVEGRWVVAVVTEGTVVDSVVGAVLVVVVSVGTL